VTEIITAEHMLTASRQPIPPPTLTNFLRLPAPAPHSLSRRAILACPGGVLHCNGSC
jgi:hypothetical protein